MAGAPAAVAEKDVPAVSIWPDSTQLTRVEAAFPGRQFRYIVNPTGHGGEVHYGIVEGDPENPDDVEKLRVLINEIGFLHITLVLGGADWEPPR
jgi:hypothetical protein